MKRVGGIIELKQTGELHKAKGSFSYRLSATKKELVVGHDGVHGYKEVPMPGYIEGEITDREDLDVRAMQDGTDETITLKLANGKTIFAKDAVYTGEGEGGTEEGNIKVRWESDQVRES
jgi:hypothetical protein